MIECPMGNPHCNGALTQDCTCKTKHNPTYCFTDDFDCDVHNPEYRMPIERGAPAFSFGGDTDTGFYVKDQVILRDPEWRDVWKMFKDWLFNRPRKFFEPNIAFAVGGEEKGEKISFHNTGNKQ